MRNVQINKNVRGGEFRSCMLLHAMRANTNVCPSVGRKLQRYPPGLTAATTGPAAQAIAAIDCYKRHAVNSRWNQPTDRWTR